MARAYDYHRKQSHFAREFFIREIIRESNFLRRTLALTDLAAGRERRTGSAR